MISLVCREYGGGKGGSTSDVHRAGRRKKGKKKTKKKKNGVISKSLIHTPLQEGEGVRRWFDPLAGKKKKKGRANHVPLEQSRGPRRGEGGEKRKRKSLPAPSSAGGERAAG